MRYVIAKVYNKEYAEKLAHTYLKVYESKLELEPMQYTLNHWIHVEVRIYAPETVPLLVNDIRRSLWDLHVIYGHGEKLEII